MEKFIKMPNDYGGGYILNLAMIKSIHLWSVDVSRYVEDDNQLQAAFVRYDTVIIEPKEKVGYYNAFCFQFLMPQKCDMDCHPNWKESGIQLMLDITHFLKNDSCLLDIEDSLKYASHFRFYDDASFCDEDTLQQYKYARDCGSKEKKLIETIYELQKSKF